MIEKKIGNINEGLTVAPTIVEPGAPMQPIPNTQHPFGELHPSDAAKAAGWIREDLDSGKMTQEQANHAWDQLGTSHEQRLPDLRTPEARAMDKQFPPAKAEQFYINYGEQPMTPELKAFDFSARTWLAAAGLTRELGNALINEAERVAIHTKNMNEGRREQYGQAEYAKLQRLYGDKVEEKLSHAGRMISDLEVKHPGLKQLLRSFSDSAMVSNILIQHSQRYWARRHKG